MKKAAQPYDTIGLGDIAGIQLPPQRWLVPGAISHPSLGMLVARRGMGKTWFSLKLALDIAHGAIWAKPFPACPARGVLLVDGEMALPDIVGRIQALLPAYSGGGGGFWLLNGEQLALKRDGINLAAAESRERIMVTMHQLEKRHETSIGLLVLDNWSSLVYGLDENSNSEIDDIRRWMVDLRHLEISVLLVHHIGKGIGQRGASAREDQLNYTIMLDSKPEAGGTILTASWDKCRGVRPNPDELTFEIHQVGQELRIDDVFMQLDENK